MAAMVANAVGAINMAPLHPRPPIRTTRLVTHCWAMRPRVNTVVETKARCVVHVTKQRNGEVGTHLSSRINTPTTTTTTTGPTSWTNSRNSGG